MFRSEILEEAIRQELSRCAPTQAMHAALRSRLRSVERIAAPRKTAATAARRLDEQLDARMWRATKKNAKGKKKTRVHVSLPDFSHLIVLTETKQKMLLVTA
jgi:hypothetical protein